MLQQYRDNVNLWSKTYCVPLILGRLADYNNLFGKFYLDRMKSKRNEFLTNNSAFFVWHWHIESWFQHVYNFYDHNNNIIVSCDILLLWLVLHNYITLGGKLLWTSLDAPLGQSRSMSEGCCSYVWSDERPNRIDHHHSSQPIQSKLINQPLKIKSIPETKLFMKFCILVVITMFWPIQFAKTKVSWSPTPS